MGLETIRQDINAVDRQLIALLEKRMVLVDQVAAYKHKQVHDVPVLDQEREAEVLRSVSQQIRHKAFEPAILELFKAIMAASRRYQAEQIAVGSNDDEAY